ncbi:protein ZGRF1 [Pelomyxa schiedti]|nr:protein ZGRF1 [Pelomyxa schiedti]
MSKPASVATNVRRFNVTYAKPIKQRKYMDGTLVFNPDNKKVTLRDFNGTVLDSEFMSRPVEVGGEITLERWVVSIDEEVFTTAPQPTLPTAASTITSCSTKSVPTLPAQLPKVSSLYKVPFKTPFRTDKAPASMNAPETSSTSRVTTKTQTTLKTSTLNTKASSSSASNQFNPPAKHPAPNLSQHIPTEQQLPVAPLSADFENTSDVNDPITPIKTIENHRSVSDILSLLKGEKATKTNTNPPVVLPAPTNCGQRCTSGTIPTQTKVTQQSTNKFALPFVKSSSLTSPKPHENRSFQTPFSKEPPINTSGLRFPTLEESRQKSTVSIEIPDTFNSASQYSKCFSQALVMELALLMKQIAEKFYSACDLVAPSLANKGKGCPHGEKLYTVNKDGPNKGRLFYKCPKGCWRWLEPPKGGTSASVLLKHPEITPSYESQVLFRQQGVHVYFNVELVSKTTSTSTEHKRGGKFAKHRNNITPAKKSLFLTLKNLEPASAYMKDDIWIISTSPSFISAQTFLAKSAFHGPTNAGHLEIKLLDENSQGLLKLGTTVHAIHAMNTSTEMAMLETLHKLTTSPPPIINRLLGTHPVAPLSSKDTEPIHVDLSTTEILALAKETAIKYNLNEDQTRVLMECTSWFGEGRCSNPCILVHGVFGAGKSFLIAVIVVFMNQILEHTKGADSHLLIAASTNTAVDRVMGALLQLDFTDFIRVGNVKKIAREILPYSLHSEATGGDENQARRRLEERKKESHISRAEKEAVDRELKNLRHKVKQDLLKSVHVVGATCAACPFKVLDNMQFEIVILDESSQLVEPLSLLPMSRFGCQKLIAVGDPMQLSPVLLSNFGNSSDDSGLSKTLFTRMTHAGVTPIMLRAQYRVEYSNISELIFLVSPMAVRNSQPPLVEGLPPLLVVNADRGAEQMDKSGSFQNKYETTIIVHIVRMLAKNDVPPESIGIIALYKAQADRIFEQLASLSTHSTAQDSAHIVNSVTQDSPTRNGSTKPYDYDLIQVSTVDAFQGAEKDLIILTSVRTTKLGFTESARRLNVAITRARNHLIIVGHLQTLSGNSTWQHITHNKSAVRKLGDEILYFDQLEMLFPRSPAGSAASNKIALNNSIPAQSNTDDEGNDPRDEEEDIAEAEAVEEEEQTGAATVINNTTTSSSHTLPSDEENDDGDDTLDLNEETAPSNSPHDQQQYDEEPKADDSESISSGDENAREPELAGTKRSPPLPTNDDEEEAAAPHHDEPKVRRTTSPRNPPPPQQQLPGAHATSTSSLEADATTSTTTTHAGVTKPNQRTDADSLPDEANNYVDILFGDDEEPNFGLL